MTTKKTISGDVTTNWRLKFLVAALQVYCQEQISASSGFSFNYKYIFPLFNKNFIAAEILYSIYKAGINTVESQKSPPSAG